MTRPLPPFQKSVFINCPFDSDYQDLMLAIVFSVAAHMTAADALAKLRAHLAKRGFGDIEVNMTGGYDPTSTEPNSLPVRVETAVYKRNGIDPIVWPRNAGSWPGYVFTGEPLKLPAIQFGFGHGNGAHAPDEYYLIDSKNPKIQGIDGAVRGHV